VIDDDRGQMDAGGQGRFVVSILIALTVAVIVLDEMSNVADRQLAGERITEVGGPAIQPGMAVGVLVIGAILLGSVQLASWIHDRRSANRDRDSANGD
jgi:hypothetical protein